MKAEINRIKWKSRRGMRELDLLFENFFKFHADKISESELQTLRELLVYDDQSLFDFMFASSSALIKIISFFFLLRCSVLAITSCPLKQPFEKET